jgi:hypothetical protein
VNGDWADVQEGDLVVGKDGYTWTVTAKDGPQVTLEREGREPFTGRPTGPVQFIDSGKAEMERAVAIGQVVLGGEVVARHSGSRENPWLVPVTFPDAGSMLAHIYLLHGKVISDEGMTLRALIKEHDDLHREKGVGYQHHHHDPDFHKAR